jgi:[pyruvate, water dikinase]-phosphate phosphotransferase / [pyruvate, water dikinase] kinase
MTDNLPPLYIVSGGAGASGEQLVRTVLAQFPDIPIPVVTVAHVRHAAQIKHVVAQAARTGGTIVHTFVDGRLQSVVAAEAAAHGVVAIDLMGDLMARLSQLLGMVPVGQPGLYRQLQRVQFDRMAAIEFAIIHDDGKRGEDWALAELVLVGVSRVGKTPLSMYLSVMGWRVANVPLVMGLEPLDTLYDLDRRRVVGLTIAPAQLALFRHQRQRRLGAPGQTAYTDPAAIYEELEMAQQVFARGGFTAIDVTDKPIETTADEIIALVTRRVGEHDPW